MSKKTKKKATKKMEKAKKNCVYVCDCCGCEVVCTAPSEGHFFAADRQCSSASIKNNDQLTLSTEILSSFHFTNIPRYHQQSP
jgi:hypothetical protein